MNTNNSTTTATVNKLANESSLYLRQHAHNPVDWYPWGEDALIKARNENKPLLISIGYSACHWCHVMEHESFSNKEVADFMNQHFVNIKIDREERPDLDQLYMEAVQLLHGHGGWPLNCFALPDGRPFWGATYFKKSQWLDVLGQIKELYRAEPETLEEQAGRISKGISQMNLNIAIAQKEETLQYEAEDLYKTLNRSFDTEWGGLKGAPKFPMPSVYRFLLHFHYLHPELNAKEHVILTLNRMAAGGIYDQVGGGFSRYSTDKYWKVPHFEKMLYDNAQLIILYCEAYMLSKDENLRRIAVETMQFLEREMGNSRSGFYASIDADSPEGEGSFYTFTLEELNNLLGKDAPIFIKYWKAGAEGKWENARNILLTPAEPEEFFRSNAIEPSVFSEKLLKAKKVLLDYRNQRPAPSTDTKIITSWNAFTIQAYLCLYRVTADKTYLDKASLLASFLIKTAISEDGHLLHLSGSNKPVTAFLDDYSALILSLISLYSASFEEKWIKKAKELADLAIQYFYDSKNGLFYYTGTYHEKTFARRQEIHDNVIPSSNSMMMEALFYLGEIFHHEPFLKIVRRAVHGMAENISKNPSAYSNWARLYLMLRFPFYTIAVNGPQADAQINEMLHEFLPQALIAGTSAASGLRVLQNPGSNNETLIHVCSGKECYPPVQKFAEAKQFLNF